MSAGIKKAALDATKVAMQVGGTLGVKTATTAAVASALMPALGPAHLAVTGLFIARFLKKYNSFRINEKTAPVNPVSETWKARPKANMVKWMMQQSGKSPDVIAEHLGCSVNYLNTKLARDSFSFEDMILVAYACGYTFTLADNNGDGEPVYRVDIIRHFEASDPSVLERINNIEESIHAAKQEEYEKKKAEIEEDYEKKKAELERMKAEFGFED